MKLTQKKLRESLMESMSKPVWAARETVGIKFEVGDRIEENLGEFHFWISTSHWWLQQGSEQNFSDVINSESNRKNIAAKVVVLNNKKLIDVEFYENDCNIVLVFEDNLFLKIAPYAGKIRELFQLFTKKQIISIMSDGTYKIEML